MTRRQQATVDAADVVIYERHIDDPWLPFLERVAKKRLFLTMDDAYWLAHPSTPTAQFWLKNDRLKKLEDVASWCEGVICPNRKLAEHFPNGIYRPNRPDYADSVWSVSPIFGQRVILWGGTSGHIAGMTKHPFLTAARLLCDEGATLVAVCGSPDLASLFEKAIPKVQVVSTMFPYNEWLKVVSGSTVLACPLGEGYDEHRSWIKALEAAAVGTRWVGSDRGVYDGAQGGVVVPDTAGAWYDALFVALHNKYSREESITWAWREGMSEHMDEWERILNV